MVRIIEIITKWNDDNLVFNSVQQFLVSIINLVEDSMFLEIHSEFWSFHPRSLSGDS